MPTSIPVGTSPAAVALIIAVPIAVAAVVLLVTLPLLGARIVITSDTISIKPSVLGSGVSFSRSDVKAMYVANLSEDRELQPTIRLWGASLMGYRYGWFKLANGHRAFLAIYGSSDLAVVAVLKDGTYVVMSPKNVSALIDALKSYGWLEGSELNKPRSP